MFDRIISHPRTAAILIALAFFVPSRPVNAQHTFLDTSIRTVNWDSLLDNDTVHFAFDSEASAYHADINSSSDSEITPFYDVVSDSEQTGGTLDGVAYVDLNHDGREDAVVTLFSGGSGHFATDLVFLQTPNGPKYSGCAGGPHFEDSIYGDTLRILTAHPLVMDPQCCNRAVDVQRIVGDGDTIRWLPLIVQPLNGGASQTVEQFYSALGDTTQLHSLISMSEITRKDAYDMLSDSYQSSHPYAQWLKGYSNTVSIAAEIDENSPDTVVRVKITSKDNIHGNIITKHFAGVWYMKFITNNHSAYDDTAIADWVLDRPEIREVK